MSSSFIVIYILCLFTLIRTDEFHESVLFRPLEDGSLFVEFKFNVIAHFADIHGSSLFYELFPKSIGELFHRLPLWEFHLTLSRGRWDYPNWGNFHAQIAPYGAELRSVFYRNHSSNNNAMNASTHFNTEWLTLQQILSGLYCASINEINVQMVNTSGHQFVPAESQVLGELARRDWSYYYGQSPKENICTENLTPWSKLLPCRRQKGLALLLQPSKIFDAHYQSMQVHVTPLSRAKFMKFTHVFQVVFDMNDADGRKLKQWDVKRLFDVTSAHMPELQGCPVAHSSLVMFDIPTWVYMGVPAWDLITPHAPQQQQQQSAPIKPLPNVVYDVGESHRSHLWIYALHTLKRLDTITVQWPALLFSAHERMSQQQNHVSVNHYLHAQRYLIEHDQIRARLVIVIRNTHPTHSIRFSYLDPLPHFLKLWFHTIAMTVDGAPIDPFQDLELFNIDFSTYKSEVVRIRNENPICMEWISTLQAGSEMKLTMDIDKKLQHFESYPPDYNRGFDVGNGMIRVLNESLNVMDYHDMFIFGDKANKQQYNSSHKTTNVLSLPRFKNASRVIYSPQVLVLLPYPDMSMVFNVIAFSCTLFAFFFGTAFNNLYRDIEDLDRRNADMIKDKLSALLRAMYKKLPCKKRENKATENNNITNENDTSIDRSTNEF